MWENQTELFKMSNTFANIPLLNTDREQILLTPAVCLWRVAGRKMILRTSVKNQQPLRLSKKIQTDLGRPSWSDPMIRSTGPSLSHFLQNVSHLKKKWYSNMGEGLFTFQYEWKFSCFKPRQTVECPESSSLDLKSDPTKRQHLDFRPEPRTYETP